jgi:hypothetical protein
MSTPGCPIPAGLRLQRAAALAATFLPDHELETLAWQIELVLNSMVETEDWQKRGDPANRDALLELLQKFRQQQPP